MAHIGGYAADTHMQTVLKKCFSRVTRNITVLKRSIAVSGNHLTATGNHMPYGITQCYLPPGSGDFPALPKPKLIIDLATLEGCKA